MEAAFTQGCPLIGQLLILAGADLRNEAWLWSRNFPEKLEHDRSMTNWLEDTVMPFSLMNLCRIKIRKLIGKCFSEVAGQLDMYIPTQLISFLRMAELGSWE